jgi:hypothetical protein
MPGSLGGTLGEVAKDNRFLTRGGVLTDDYIDLVDFLQKEGGGCRAHASSSLRVRSYEEIGPSTRTEGLLRGLFWKAGAQAKENCLGALPRYSSQRAYATATAAGFGTLLIVFRMRETIWYGSPSEFGRRSSR